MRNAKKVPEYPSPEFVRKHLDKYKNEKQYQNPDFPY